MTRKYFGTDGIRGKVGEDLINPEFALKLGWAAGVVLTRHLDGKQGKVILGKDTRNSGYMLESALEAGFSAAGINTFLTGPMPTPAIAYLTRTLRMDAGVVISASHNPYYDNGIKFFAPDGHKLNDQIELEIEKLLNQDLKLVSNELLGRAKRLEDATARYIEFCKGRISSTFHLKGMKIVVDCANGAAYKVAPAVFKELGATVTVIGDQPNGFNINLNCGSTSLEQIKKTVIQQQADLGVALDGDADRVILIDHKGNVIDGDQIIYLIVRSKHLQGQMRGGVVGTVMSNEGLQVALAQLNIPFARAKVSDRYVIEMMLKKGWSYGAENSGHIINYESNTTGDGIIATVEVLKAMVAEKQSLYQLTKHIQLFPQVLVNVNLEGLVDNVCDTSITRKAINNAQQKIAQSGRLLIRKSGTEPLVRIMIEHKDSKLAHDLAHDLAKIIEQQKT